MAITACMTGLFIILGVVFSFGKGNLLIAGFNTMSEEEKNRYDIPALCKFMGKMMFALAFCVFLWFLSEYLLARILFTVGLVLFTVTIIFMLIYVNTGNRFKK